MSNYNLFRLSGLAMILGGILLFAHYATHPQGESAVFVAMPLWIPSHILEFVAWSFILLGLIGVYLRQSEKAGMLGFIAFLFAFVTALASAGAGLWGGAVFQTLFPHSVDPGGALLSSQGARLAVDFAELWILAFPLFGLVTLRARVMPRVGSWLLVFAALLGLLALALLPFGSPTQYYLADVASALFGFGLGIWGFRLWSGKRESTAPLTPAIQESHSTVS